MPEWLSTIESHTALDILGGFVGGILIATFGRYRARRQWERHHDVHQLNVSLNVFAEGYLKIRTVFERPLEHVLPNLHAREVLLAAAKRCTIDDPMLALTGDHHRFVLNYIVNATVEHFSLGDRKSVV